MKSPQEKGRYGPPVIKNRKPIDDTSHLPKESVSDNSEIGKRKPIKRYKCVLADPPWSVQQKGHYGASSHYDLMSIEQIAGLGIPDLLEDNAHLWLWVTNASLPYAYDLLKSWGLEYRSIYHWIKPRMGLGQYLRNASESMLLATRGKAPVLFKGQMNWNFLPVQEHSKKPQELYSMIERLSPGPYLELFARCPRHGWDQWGAEIPSDVIIPGYPVPEYTEKAGTPLPEDIAPPGMFKSSMQKKKKEG